MCRRYTCLFTEMLILKASLKRLENLWNVQFVLENTNCMPGVQAHHDCIILDLLLNKGGMRHFKFAYSGG